MTIVEIMPAAVTGVVGIGLWFLFRRPIEEWQGRIAKLENEVMVVRDQRIAGIEKTQEKCEESRRRIHQEIDEVRAKFMHKTECGRLHDKVEIQIAGLVASLGELKTVAERANQACHAVEKAQEEIVAARIEVAKVAASMRRTA